MIFSLYGFYELKTVEFVLSKYGRPVIQMGGYRYNKHSPGNGRKIQWLCSKRRSPFFCHGKLTTYDGEVIALHDDHNH
ncbi:unnamed protein product [Parnassius mnemosyne]|uniref:FLYWCH-type domain-containing protein n=1 Tax=Parnassius mnemosyne TaxID=213953 RepID=A0AAV1K7T0_9NEOP